MRQYRIYIITTLSLFLGFCACIILILYRVESQFHLPAYNHISLDAKLHFLKHHTALDKADTIVVGSSLGLNNINGPLLQESSAQVDTVLNISAWNMSCANLEPLLNRIVDLGHVKRIIYLTQYLDFTGVLGIKGPSDDIVFGYLNDDTVDTFLFILRTSKNLINLLDQYLRWEVYTHAETYENLIFDKTGGSLLDMNQLNANPHRWGDVDAYSLASFKQANLSCLKNMVALSQAQTIDFFFVISPFRKALIVSHPELEKIMLEFDTETQKILQESPAYHINAHRLLNLDDSNFADKSHLNSHGATAISRKLAGVIERVSGNKPVISKNVIATKL